MARRRNERRLAKRQLACSRPAVAGLALLTLLWVGPSAQANSWCDDIDTGGLTVGGLPTTVVAMLDLALDGNQEVALRKQATLGLCRVAQKGGQEAIDGLMILASDREAEIRAASLQTLGLLATEEQHEQLRRSLQDEDSAVRLKAVFALAQLGCTACFDSLVETCGDPAQEIAVREHAAIALGKHRYPGALSVLQAQVTGETGGKGNLPLLSALSLAALRDDSGLDLLASAALTPSTREGLRVKSIQAIESLTGQEFGYVNKYYVPATREQQADAMELLANWWRTQKEEVGR